MQLMGIFAILPLLTVSISMSANNVYGADICGVELCSDYSGGRAQFEADKLLGHGYSVKHDSFIDSSMMMEVYDKKTKHAMKIANCMEHMMMDEMIQMTCGSLKNRAIALNETNNLIDDNEMRIDQASKYSYEKLISNTDPSIRDDVIHQINYTMTAFQEAQDAIKLIQESGESYEDAVDIYSENNPLSRETLEMILAGYSYDDIQEHMETKGMGENTSVADSNSTVLDIPANDLNSTVTNQTVAENITISEPTYSLYISATALNWDLPPSGTSINLTGSAIGLSSSGKIMVGVNGTLVELQLHELKIAETP